MQVLMPLCFLRPFLCLTPAPDWLTATSYHVTMLCACQGQVLEPDTITRGTHSSPDLFMQCHNAQ